MSSEELLAQLEQNKMELEVVKKGQEETQAVIHELRLMMSALLSAPRNINTSPPSLPAAREDPDDTYDAREMPRHIEREPPPPSIPPLSTFSSISEECQYGYIKEARATATPY